MNHETLGNRMDKSHYLPDGWGSFLEWEDNHSVPVLDKWRHADPARLETDGNTLGKEVAEKIKKIMGGNAES